MASSSLSGSSSGMLNEPAESDIFADELSAEEEDLSKDLVPDVCSVPPELVLDWPPCSPSGSLD